MVYRVEYTIEFGGDPQDVTITTTGLADAEGLVALVRDLVDSPEFRPGMLILEDCLGIDVSQVKPSDFRQQADAVIKRDERIGPSKAAIIVPSPVTYGYARMWQSYVDSQAEIESKIFYTRAEGLEWLKSHRVDRPD